MLLKPLESESMRKVLREQEELDVTETAFLLHPHFLTLHLPALASLSEAVL